MSLMRMQAGILGGALATVTYAPTAAVFDGTDALYRIGTSDTDPLTGAVDGKLFSASFAIKRLALSGGGINFPRIVGGQILATTTRWSIGFEPDDTLYVELRDASGNIGYFKTATAITTLNTWLRVGVSANTGIVGNSNGQGSIQIVIDGTPRTLTIVTENDTTRNIDFTTAIQTVGARMTATSPLTFAPNNMLNAEIADLAVYFDRAINWSTSSEWERFFEAGTHALKWKANDGSIPYGVSPIIYQSGAIGQWHVNRGYGSGFALSGALTASTSPPAGAAIPQYDITGFSAVLTSDIFLAPGSDNWPTTWLRDNTQLTVGADGGGFGGTNTSGRDALFVSRLPNAAPSVASDVAARQVWGGFDPEGGVVSTFNGKSYGIVAVGGTVYMAVGRQDLWPDNSNDQFRNVHLYKSTTNGTSWTDTGVAWNPTTLGGAFSLPTFLCCGRANGAAFDAYVYMFASGAKTLASGDPFTAHHSQHLYLARAPASGMETQGAWEYYTGAGPTFSTNIANRQPVPGCSGVDAGDRPVSWATCVAYIPEIDRCLYLRNRAESTDATADGVTDFEIMTAQRPWGPWTRVDLYSNWQPWQPPPAQLPSVTNRYNFTFYLPPRWIGPQSGLTIPCKLVYSGSRAVENERFDAWQCTSATLTLTQVAGPTLSAPVITALPSISPSGEVISGTVLTVSNGTWTNSPTAYAYQWLRGATNVGTNVNTYTTVVPDEGSTITCRVTASNAAGSSTPATTSAGVTVTSAPSGGIGIPVPAFEYQTISDAHPVSNFCWWNPSAPNDSGNGQSKAAAKKTFSVAEGVITSGGTIIVAGGTHTVGTIAPTKPMTIRAEQNATVVLYRQPAFRGAWERTWTWTQIDSGKRIWESPSISHGFAAGTLLDGFIVIPNGGIGKHFMRLPPALSSADFATSTLSTGAISSGPSYGVPWLWCQSNDRIRVRMQKPPVAYCKNTWPTDGRMGTLINSSGEWQEPTTQNPNDYQIFIINWAAKGSNNQLFDFTNVSNITVRGINAALVGRAFRLNNAQNVRVERGTYYVDEVFAWHQSNTNNFTASHVRTAMGDQRHISWNDYKIGSRYYNGDQPGSPAQAQLRGTFIDTDDPVSSSTCQNMRIEHSTVYGFFDLLLPYSGSAGPWTLDHCAIIRNVDDGLQKPATLPAAVNIGYTYWRGGPFGGWESNVKGTAHDHMHHCVIHLDTPMSISGGIAPQLMMPEHSTGGTGPVRGCRRYYNTFIGSPDPDRVHAMELLMRGRAGTGLERCLYNNLIVMLDNKRFEGGGGDAVSSRVACQFSAAGVVRTDHNLYYRSVPSPSGTFFLEWQNVHDSGQVSFSSLAAFRSHQLKTTSRSMYAAGTGGAFPGDGTDGHEHHGVEQNPQFRDIPARDYRPQSSGATGGAKSLTSTGWPGTSVFQNWKGALDPNGDGSEVGPQE